jgi:hypothetical protein
MIIKKGYDLGYSGSKGPGHQSDNFMSSYEGFIVCHHNDNLNSMQ